MSYEVFLVWNEDDYYNTAQTVTAKSYKDAEEVVNVALKQGYDYIEMACNNVRIYETID